MALRTQIYLQLSHDSRPLLLGNMRQQVRDKILLSALAEYHAVDRERTTKSMYTLSLAAKRERRHMALNLRIAEEKPIGHEIIFVLRTPGAADPKHRFPYVGCRTA